MQVIRGKSFQQCLCRLVRGIKIERSIPARNTFRGEKVVSEEQHSRWLEGCLATSRTQRGRSEKTDRSVRRGCISQQFSKMPDRAKHTSSERAFVVVVVVAKSEHAGGCDQKQKQRCLTHRKQLRRRPIHGRVHRKIGSEKTPFDSKKLNYFVNCIHNSLQYCCS